jgi:thiol-disulfide isomerase/thioredoxin
MKIPSGLARKNCILKFTADWCGPCRTIKQSLHQEVEHWGVHLEEVDVDQSKEISDEFEITGLPTIVFLECVQGKFEERKDLRVVGADKELIKQRIRMFAQASSNQIDLLIMEDANIKCQR